MSTTFRLSFGRLAAGVAVLIAAASATPAADIPTNSCVSQKLSAASNACNWIFGAWVKAPPTGDDPDVDAAVARAAEKLASKWSKAEQFARGGDCAQSAPTSDTVLSDIASAAGNISNSVKAGVDLKNQTDVTCRMKLVRIAGKYCTVLLGIDSSAARGVSPLKLAPKRSKQMDGMTRQLSAATCEGGATPDAIAAAIVATEDAVVADTLAP